MAPDFTATEFVQTSRIRDARSMLLQNDSKHWSDLAKRIEDTIAKIPYRCDLNSLLREGEQHRVDLRQNYTIKCPARESMPLPFPADLICSGLDCPESVTAALLYAWHKALQVFAGGEQTVLAVSDVKGQQGGAYSGRQLHSIVDHAKTRTQSCLEILQLTQSQLQSPNYGDLGLSHLNWGLYDSHMVLTAETHDQTLLRHPLTVVLHLPLSGQPTLDLMYAAELFTQRMILSLIHVFKVILVQLVDEPARLVADLEFINEEQAKTLNEWNHTDGEYESAARLEQLFEQAVAANPLATAVKYKNRTLTYEQLNTEANRLAYYLRHTAEVYPEQVVALFLDKNELMIATVLGVWKSGACYSPIDPTYPDSRARFSLDDTGARVVITNHWHSCRLQDIAANIAGLKVIELEHVMEHLRADPQIPCTNPCFSLWSDQLCYITYTSGTTGTPKGIKKRHTNVVNSITDLANRYNMKSSPEVVVLFSPYVFEPFARQTLMALLNSHTLLVVDDDEKLDPVSFPKLMSHYGVTYLNGTASVLQEFDYSACPELKRLILVGEDLTGTRYQNLRKKFKRQIINEYGFTESAFVTAVKFFKPGDQRPNRSLGRPLRNVKCYVLGQNLKRVPLGATGELYIGGQGVSEGYLNRPELTAERFLSNPYQTAAEKEQGMNPMIYRTGDLARWIPDSQEVEYLGRNDFQIKLRGIRIEPGEIESVLANHPSVQSAVVIAAAAPGSAPSDSEGIKHLVGYWTGDRAQSEEGLITYLESHLPRYMVPTRLVKLQRIPTTINGKVDFRTLPTVDLVRNQTSTRHPPQTTVERILQQIWCQLLGIPSSTLGTNDNFFRLGGNSVTCIRLIGCIRQKLHANLTVEHIFAQKTIANLASLLERLKALNAPGLNDEHDQCSIDPNSIGIREKVDAVYVANSLQQGFMYHYLKRDLNNDSSYTMQYASTYRKLIDRELYRSAWVAAQLRYSSLRLRFATGIEIYQVVDSQQPLDFRYLDFFTGSEEEDAALPQLSELQEKDRLESYQLDQGPLYRIYLVRTGLSHFHLLFSCHHAILDGWSVPILLDYVHETYLSLLHGSKPSLFADQPYHTVQKLSNKLREENLPYWEDKVKSITERCDLRGLMRPNLRYKKDLASYDSIEEAKEKSVHLGSTWKSTLREVCNQHEIMLHSVLQFIVHEILHIYGNGLQSVVGTIVSGRNLPIDGVDQTVGLLINTLPLVVDHEQQRSGRLLDALRSIQKDSIAMNMHSLVDLGRLCHGQMTHELFDCLLVLENYPVLDEVRHERLRRELAVETKGTTEKLTYPLAFVCSETKDRDVTVTLRYAAELFEESTVDDILEVFQTLFDQLPQKLEHPVTSLDLLGSSQLSRLLQWNSSDVEYPQVTIDFLFEEMVATYPDKIAIAYEDCRLTYAQLNVEANRLARLLRSRITPRPDCVVALLLDKGMSMFVAILAVWKAGMAYTPIDAGLPHDRIYYVVEETNAAVVLVNQRHSGKFKGAPFLDSLVLSIEDAIENARGKGGENLDHFAQCTDLAYIYFTSGSTGVPKGVMVEHRGVVNLQQSLQKTFGLRTRPDEVFLSFSNYTFDHFVEQMTDALLTGQTLLILNDEMRADKDRLYRYIRDYRVTYLSGTPSVISMYDYDQFPWLRYIDCVGEDFTEPVFERIRNGFKGIIINGYGPTEASITTHKRLYTCQERRLDKSIGLQIDNSRTYILDQNMRLLPVGAIGELFLGGDGVARGYLNRPELNRERFPQNPHRRSKDEIAGRDERLYKTGDLARWLPNGQIEFLGRNDFQIKLRGQRVELGEIEAAIASCDSVTKSTVVPQTRVIPGSDVALKFLIAYFLASRNRTEADLRNELREKLPEHLIPNRLVMVDNLPVTVSGKLDVKRLPVVDYATGREFVEPESFIEANLVSVWSGLLGVPQNEISVAEDFFALGGDSLLITRLAFMVTKHFARNVTVAHIFDHRTIRKLSQFIQTSAEGLRLIGNAFDTSADAPASFSQERLLFIARFLEGSSAYNVPKYLRLPRNTDSKILRRTLYELMSRHAALRTLLIIDRVMGKTTQRVLDTQEAMTRLSFEETTVESQFDLDTYLDIEARHVFNLDSDLPFRIALLHVQNIQDSFLALNIHHVAIDAWSWDVFLRDLHAIYSQLTHATPKINLPELQVSYAMYSTWQKQQFSTDRSQVLQSYWTGKLQGYALVPLPTDYQRPPQFQYEGCDLEVTLMPDIVDKVHQMARCLQTSTFSIFASAYCYMLSTFSGQNDIIIGLPLANRQHLETENVIGCFVNTVPLRIKIKQEDTCSTLLRIVHKEISEAQMNQDHPLEELVRQMRVEHDASRHPIFQHVFSSDVVTNLSSNIRGDDRWCALEYRPSNRAYSSSKFDLSTTVTRRDSQTIINFNWPKTLFSHETVEQFASTYQHILHQLVDSAYSERTLSSCSLSPFTLPTDMPNCEGNALQGSQSLASLFSHYVNLYPDNPAVACRDKIHSYRQLDLESSQMTNYLWKKGLRPGQWIGLMLEPSFELICSILAVWKLECGYVPLGSGSSVIQGHFFHVIQDTGLKIIISRSEFIQPSMDGLNLLRIDDQNVRLAMKDATSAPDLRISAKETPAYCIYTSGTTGVAKGVPVPQKGVICLASDLRARYFGSHRTEERSEAVLMTSNYAFDFSVEQFALSFLSGHKLILLPDGVTGDDDFYNYLNHAKLTYLSGTPSILSRLDMSRLVHLHTITSAGERLQLDQYEKLRRGFSGSIYNAYGCTESTVYNLVHQFREGDAFLNTLGEPIAGHAIYVANGQGRALPPGAVGELYISGEGVTGSYLNQPTLSRARFLPNPFVNAEGTSHATVYKTGDLVRRTFDGRLEYIGRDDQQVKLRGFRIELGHVQNTLAAYPGIKECAVLGKSRAGQITNSADHLIAYYYCEQPLEPDSIRAFLDPLLPAAFIPTFFVHTPSPLPTNANGKLETRLLQSIETTRVTTLEPSRDATEALMCRIWSTTLKTDVGIHDNFFHSGGDSIMSLRLVQEMSERLGSRITVQDIFEGKTIYGILRRLRKLPSRAPVSIQAEQGALVGSVSTLPIQNWFFAKSLKRPSHWNQCFIIRTPALDLARLSAAYAALQTHHDAFRLCFCTKGSKVSQGYEEKANNPDIVVLRGEMAEKNLAESLTGLHSSLDIHSGKVATVAYIPVQPGRGLIWLGLHHLITDVVSWQIIARDLEVLYNGRQLGAKGSSYRQWAKTLQQYTPDKGECSYWENVITQISSGLPCVERQEPTNKVISIANIEIAALFKNNCASTFELLLTSVSRAITTWNPLATAITIESHGRDSSLDQSLDVSSTVGWFTAMWPLILPFSVSLGEHIELIKIALARVPRKGIGFGVMHGYGALPQITFNYLGRTSPAIKGMTSWSVEPAMTPNWGACRYSEDSKANNALLDITIQPGDDSFVIVLDSQLSEASTEKIAQGLSSSISEITGFLGENQPRHKLNSHIDIASKPIRDFVPFFKFDEAPRQGPILFLLPPGEGGAESYFQNLVTHLPHTQLVAFNNLHLHNANANATFPSLAKQYIRWLRESQPQGPYHLLGWSFGGVLALEMCLQLLQDGETVQSLTFIDSYFDVRRASAAVGYPDDDSILDPINWRYRPEPSVLARIASQVQHITLFKAGKVNERARSERQEKLFGWYQDSPRNGLDGWVDAEAEVVKLEGETHFTWVGNGEVVKMMSDVIVANMEG